MFYYVAQLVQLSRQSVFYQAAVSAEPEGPSVCGGHAQLLPLDLGPSLTILGFGLWARC